MGPKGPRSLMAIEYRRGRMCRMFAVYSVEPDAVGPAVFAFLLFGHGRLGVDKTRTIIAGRLSGKREGVLTHTGYEIVLCIDRKGETVHLSHHGLQVDFLVRKLAQRVGKNPEAVLFDPMGVFAGEIW